MSRSNCKVSGCENKIVNRSSMLCSKHHNKRVRDNRRKYAIDYLGGRCNVCKKQSDKYEFDHIRPETVSFRIAVGLAFNINRLKSELDKCQLLCVDCHLVKTMKERGYSYTEHGVSKYVNHGCRCEYCKVAWREYFKTKRKSRAKRGVIQ